MQSIGLSVALPNIVPVTSFYVGPGRSRLNLNTWDDAVAAAQVGALTETQWVELKEAVPASSSGANTELARDLASLSVDGGALVIGIRNPGQAAEDVVGTPDDVEQLRQRIDQIARSRITPPLTLETHVIRNPAGERPLLAVRIPPSPDAPHMVDEKYWGRSATGKRPLTDAETTRLWQGRRGRERQFSQTMTATAALDPLPPADRRFGHFYLTAEPAVAPAISLTAELGTTHPLQVILQSLTYEPTLQPSLKSVRWHQPHPDGVLTVCDLFERNGQREERWLLQLLLGDEGTVRLVSGAATTAQTAEILAIRPTHILELTHQFIDLVSYISHSLLAYSGSWQLGVQVDGLEGLYPRQAYEQRLMGLFAPSPYPQSAYVQAISATAAEVAHNVPIVVERLLSRFIRGLGLTGYLLPYTDITVLAQRG